VKLARIRSLLPEWKNALLAVLSAVLLILAFPDFELWFLAWFALVPLLFAIEREVERGHSCPHEPEGRTTRYRLSTFFRMLSHSCGQECPRSFFLGWIFGFVFFSGTCWWLTYAPIHYAGFPILLAYFLLFCVTAVAAIFPGIFGLLLSVFLRRFGTWAFLLAPFVWVFTEFLRYWITGNNWNAIGYSQAFTSLVPIVANLGGLLLVSWLCVIPATLICFSKFHPRIGLKVSIIGVVIVFSLPPLAELVRNR
jgi:apolipoprotein N-acyltransferase